MPKGCRKPVILCKLVLKYISLFTYIPRNSAHLIYVECFLNEIVFIFKIFSLIDEMKKWRWQEQCRDRDTEDLLANYCLHFQKILHILTNKLRDRAVRVCSNLLLSLAFFLYAHIWVQIYKENKNAFERGQGNIELKIEQNQESFNLINIFKLVSIEFHGRWQYEEVISTSDMSNYLIFVSLQVSLVTAATLSALSEGSLWWILSLQQVLFFL